MGYDPSSVPESPEGQRQIQVAQEGRRDKLCAAAPKEALVGMEKPFTAKINGKNRSLLLRPWHKEKVVLTACRKLTDQRLFAESVAALLQYRDYLHNAEAVYNILFKGAQKYTLVSSGEKIEEVAKSLSSESAEHRVINETHYQLIKSQIELRRKFLSRH